MLILVVFSIFVSCFSTKSTEKRHGLIIKNSYRAVYEDKFKSVVNNDTVILNEIKYESVYTAFYIQKGMYDRFGKWNKAIYTKDETHPILLWNNVKLFPNDTTKFIVAASGLESDKTIYASVLVFDNNSRDLLSEASKYKTRLIDYFSEMIKSNNSNKKDFYEVYWNDFNTRRVEKMKQYIYKNK